MEYCTPVLVLYEMEAEGKAGLTPEQKKAQLQVFYRCLKKLCSNAKYSQDIQFICYDGKSYYYIMLLFYNAINVLSSNFYFIL